MYKISNGEKMIHILIAVASIITAIIAMAILDFIFAEEEKEDKKDD